MNADTVRSVDFVRERLRDAVARCRHAEDAFQAKHNSPTATADEKIFAARQLQKAENDFCWQWRNVELLLKKYECRPAQPVQATDAVEVCR